MKLTELQAHKIDRALQDSQSVLAQIKQKRLRGRALADMKILERGVVYLDTFKMNAK